MLAGAMQINSFTQVNQINQVAVLLQVMQQAETATETIMGRMSKHIKGVEDAFGLLGKVSLPVVALAAWVKSGIDAADALGKLSASTGVAVQDLAGLKLAFEQGGAGKGFEDTMAKLSNSLVDGNEGLKALHISVKNSDGTFKSSKDTLYSVADAFSTMEDGTQKAALAVKIFGADGAGMIPMLNEGSAGLRKMNQEAAALGLVIGSDVAAQAAAFNDKIGMLEQGGKGIAMQMAAELLPTLNSVGDAFLTTMNQGSALRDTAQALATVMKLLYTVGVAVTQVFSIAGKAIGATAAQFAVLISGSGSLLDRIKQAANIGADYWRDVGTGLAAAAKTVEAAWSDGGKAAAVKPAAVTPPKVKPRVLIGEDGAAARKARDYIASLRTEREQMTLNADQAKMMEAARAAAEAPTAKLRLKIMEEALALDKATKAQLAKTESEKQATEAKRTLDADTQSILAQVAALEAEGAAQVKLASAVTDANIARMKGRLDSEAAGSPIAAELRKQIAALERLKELQAAKEGKEAGEKDAAEVKAAQDALNGFLDPGKAASFGQTLKAAFGSAGEALGQLAGQLEKYGEQQAAVDAARESAGKAYGKDSSKLAAANLEISKKEVRQRLGSYADMAGAAKGFFKENSTGYKVMEKAEKAFRMAETAMAIENMLTKSGLLSAFTGLFVASKTTEVAASQATVAPTLAAEGAKQGAYGVSALASALQAPFPANLPAFAMVAAMLAAIGVAVGGSGSGGQVGARQRQEAAGTGTVLGDPKAKSDSIAKSLELLEQSADVELTHTAGMLSALRSIDSSMRGFANVVVRSLNVKGADAAAQAGFQTDAVGSAIKGLAGNDMGLAALLGNIPVLGKVLGGIVGSVANFISKGFGTKTSVLDSGILVGAQTLASVQASGLLANGYTDVEKKKKALFITYDKSASTQLSSLSSEITTQLGLVIGNLAAGTRSAAELLGVSGDEFNARMNGFVVNLGKISLKDLSGEEIQKQFEAIFSALGDNMARQAVPGLEAFQKVGEGMFQTLTRVATNYANLDSALQSIGREFGGVGMSSLAARERLIEFMGGVDKLAEKTSGFAQNYLSESERLAPVTRYVAEQMAALGLSSITTRDQFKQQVLGLDLTTEAGARQYAALMNLEAAFAKAYPAIEATTEAAHSAKQIADEREQLQSRLKEQEAQIEQRTLSPRQLADRQRAATDAGNRDIFDQLQEKLLINANAGYLSQIAELEAARLTLHEQRELEKKDLDDSTKALYDRRAALQDEAKLAATNADYRRQIDELLKARLPVAQQREQDKAGMDQSTRELYDERARLQDEAKVAGVNADYQRQIEELEKAARPLAEQRALEIQAMDASTLVLYSRRAELQKAAEADEKAAKAAESARSALEAAHARESSSLQDVISKAEEFAKSMRTFSSSLLLADASPLSAEAKYAEARRQFEQAAPEDKQAAATAFLEASRQWNGNSEAYANDFSAVQAGILLAATSAEAQADVARSQLAALNQSVAGILKVDASVQSVAAALAAYNAAAIAAAKAAQANGLVAAQPAPAPALPPAAAAEAAQKAQLEALYKTILGRSSDESGMAFWLAAMKRGVSFDSIKADFFNSAEYLSRQAAVSGLGGVDNTAWSLSGEQGIAAEPPLAGVRQGALPGESRDMAGSLRELVTEARADKVQRAAVADAQARDNQALRDDIAGLKRKLGALA